MDAELGEADEGVAHARLRQIARGAVVIGRVIRRLRHDDHHRNVLQIRELPRRLLLHPAAHEVGLVRLVLANEFKLGLGAERRVVGDRNIGDAARSFSFALNEIPPVSG
jgi:hypothetical protein